MMGLNQQKGNMYGFVTHTWNAIKGICSHDCVYCYMKGFKQRPLRLDNSEFRTNLGKGNFIFVGSSTDMFAIDVPDEWIEAVLLHCCDYPENRYLFQSKNPKRFRDFLKSFPPDTIFGTTIESNRPHKISKAPKPIMRVVHMALMSQNHKTMVTIEPILDFDLEELVGMVMTIQPEWVNIGADSKGHKLEEPNSEKIGDLIGALKEFTEVKFKNNLKRLYMQ